MDEKNYKIIPFTPIIKKSEPENVWDIDFKTAEQRYAICDLSEKIIDDANGYGYKSMQSAHKAASYKFNGGKKKHDKIKSEAKSFMKKYPSVSKDLESEMFYALKDGEQFNSSEFWGNFEQENNIQVLMPIRKYIEKC
jgi:hypothetical protein